jgi:hypothetical protein
MEGYLVKWTNYLLGWQRRYLILHNGVLHYCKEKGSAQRGTISLNISTIEKHPTNSKRFSITTGTTTIYFKAFTSQDANDWIRALQDQKLDLKFTETRLDASTVSSIILDKVSAMWGIHSQLLNAIELIPHSKSLEPITQLLNQMKNISANTLGIIEHEHEKIQSPLKINRFSCEGAPPEHEKEEDEVQIELGSEDQFEDAESGENEVKRTSLPMLRIPKKFLNIWESLKESMSLPYEQVSVPLKYFEPLSLLQRQSEEFFYVNILQQAGKSPSRDKTLALILAYVAATFAGPCRTTKPFNANPGETFELRHQGCKVLIEQVTASTSAMHCSEENFEYFGSTEIMTQNSNNLLEISPVGRLYFKPANSSDVFTWSRPSFFISDLSTSNPSSFVSGEIRVTLNSASIFGVLSFGKTISGKVIQGDEELWNVSVGEQVTVKSRSETFSFPLIRVEDLQEYSYNFSMFTLQLNLPGTFYDRLLETDSRWRKDIRALEEGNLQECEKFYTKNNRSNDKSPQAKWFRKGKDWEFSGKYWERYD